MDNNNMLNEKSREMQIIDSQIRGALFYAMRDCENAVDHIKDDKTGFVHDVGTYMLHYIKEANEFCNKDDMKMSKSRTLFVYRNVLIQHDGYSVNKDKIDIKRLVEHLEEAIDLFEKYY